MGGGVAFLNRWLRFPILFVFLGSLLAALYVMPPAEPAALVLACLGGFVIALALLRNWPLALSAAMAPLPGILWFGVSAYALCIALAILLAAAYQAALLKGEDAMAAIAKVLPALAGTLLFAILWALHEPVQLRSLLAASLATVLFLPALVLIFRFDEEAIARGNRQREILQRFFAYPARLAEPRWSMSFAGVGMVLAVLGYSQILHRPPVFEWLSAVAIALIVLVLARDARSALAALAVSALLLIFTGGVSGAQLLFLLFALLLARSATGWRQAGETAPASFLHAIEDTGPPILFAGLAAMAAALARSGPVAALHAGYSLTGALVLFPAFAGTLHALLPRRRRLEELYKSNAS